MGVAVDSSHVYWINTNTDAVRRANPDGSNPQDLVPGQFALATGGVAVDASHLYWTSYVGGPTAGTIRRANLDGSNPQTIVPGQAAPFGIAVDASHLYWTNSGDGTIWRASLDGTNAQSIVQGEGQDSLFAVAVDASHLYWTNRSQGMVKRADLEGTNPQTLLLGQNQPQAVAVDANYVYWSDLGDQTGAIRRASLVDGANPQVFIPNTDGPQLMVAVPPAPPKLGFTPSPYDFGEVTAGQPASQAFTLANTGATASGTLAVTLAGQAGFTKSGDSCTGTSLGPGQSCTVTVQFTPASYAPVSATLTAAGQDPAATAAVALTGSGVGHLYWTNNPTGGGFPEGSVIMANRDGSGQRELFSGQDVPSAVAVGGGRLYWVTNNSDSGEGNGAIHRANLDGSDPQTIATGQSLGESPGGGLAVDASYVYWTADNGTIWRANHDGTGANVIATWESGPAGVAVDGGFIYWADFDNGTIWRAGLDGGNPKLIATGQVHPVGVAVDASHVYWANLDNGEIIQASLDGSNAKPIATGQNHPLGVAVDGDHLYWAVWFDGTIVQAGLDGSNPRLVASGQNTPTGLAVGWWVSVPRFLYLASPGGGIFAANLNASNPRPLVGARSDTGSGGRRQLPLLGDPERRRERGRHDYPGQPRWQRPAVPGHRERQPRRG